MTNPQHTDAVTSHYYRDCDACSAYVTLRIHRHVTAGLDYAEARDIALGELRAALETVDLAGARVATDERQAYIYANTDELVDAGVPLIDAMRTAEAQAATLDWGYPDADAGELQAIEAEDVARAERAEA